MGGTRRQHEDEEKKSYKPLVGKPEGKRAFGSPRSEWENNMKGDVGKMGLEVWTGDGLL
jgi:hypothetical protein